MSQLESVLDAEQFLTAAVWTGPLTKLPSVYHKAVTCDPIYTHLRILTGANRARASLVPPVQPTLSHADVTIRLFSGTTCVLLADTRFVAVVRKDVTAFLVYFIAHNRLQ